jgi:4-hydroxybenzoate polyprenyltransferase
MRPTHWIKNLFVVAPILFSGRYVSLEAWEFCLIAVASFCLLSSAVYLLNDLLDRVEDRNHPRKKHRPIASGRVSPALAAGASVLLAAAGMALASLPGVLRSEQVIALGGHGLLAWAGTYLVLNVLYSTWLKQHLYVDVIVIALGFVLRAMAGAAAIAVGISPWLVLCTFTLCLFLGFTKRRGEQIQISASQARASRRTHAGYEPEELDRLITLSASLAIVTYGIYCIAPATVSRIGSAHMIWTIPLVMYGIFRYDRISRKRHLGDVVQVLLGDRALLGVLSVYVIVSLLVLRYGGRDAFASILQV